MIFSFDDFEFTLEPAVYTSDSDPWEVYNGYKLTLINYKGQCIDPTFYDDREVLEDFLLDHGYYTEEFLRSKFTSAPEIVEDLINFLTLTAEDSCEDCDDNDFPFNHYYN